MKPKLIITADDFGLTRHITDSILEAADDGALNNVSVIANGGAVDYALAEYWKRSTRLSISIHLNLTEGLATDTVDRTKFLTDDDGRFRHSFVSLWCGYVFSLPRKRRVIRSQIRDELSAQINKIRTILGDDVVFRVDGHQHIHMLPFVFDELLKICKEFKISSIRIPTEPFFFAKPVSVYFSPNIAKHALLNILGWRGRALARMAGVQANSFFIGVLFTGHMTKDAVESGLKRIIKISNPDSSTEIIFHPGEAKENEIDFLGKYYKNLDWHFSPWRKRERDLLKMMRYKLDKQ